MAIMVQWGWKRNNYKVLSRPEKVITMRPHHLFLRYTVRKPPRWFTSVTFFIAYCFYCHCKYCWYIFGIMDPSGAVCQVSVLGGGGWRERSGSWVLALHMDGGHQILPFVWMVGTSSGPSWGWWAVAAHPTSLRIPTCSSVFIRNRKEGYGSGQSYLHGGQVGDAVHCLLHPFQFNQSKSPGINL